MKKKKKSQKKSIIYIIIGIGFLLLALASTTFAFWSITKNQENENLVNTVCLDVSFTGRQDINVPNAYPMSIDEGTLLDPYIFTITNECGNSHYVINLETVTSGVEKSLKEEYLRGYLTNDKEEILFNDTLKDEYINNEKVIKTSSKAIKLYEGDLNGKGSSATFNLRLWLDENVEDEDSMSATYEGKITVTSNYQEVKNTGVNTLKELANTKPSMLAFDGKDVLGSDAGTTDNNLRFVGADPDNYVEFNNETWRIIGVMDNIEEENGNTGSHIKIIRDSIGEYSWDSSESNVNNGYGVNEWSISDINAVLNNQFYKKEAGGVCYRSNENKVTDCPKWEEIGLDSEARSMISKVKWNTGTMPEAYNASLITPIYMYEMERSNNKSKICKSDSGVCSDNENRTTQWPGYVGLMYPSDYGFATTGGDKVSRATCLTTNMYSWKNDDNLTDCAQKSWLLDDTTSQWTMTPSPVTDNAYSVFRIHSSGSVDSSTAYSARIIRPVVYLKTEVQILDSTDIDYGSINNPYKLSI